jgi:hypothetical protein
MQTRCFRHVDPFESDGRADAKFENTIGYFSHPLYMHVEVPSGLKYMQLIDRVTEEVCNAHASADHSLLEARLPRPDFARSTGFNWEFRTISPTQSVR